MNEIFLKKTGIITTYIASELISLKKEDRLPIISDYQKRFGVSRGTVQNALNFLKERGAIVCESRGQLGTFLVDIDYGILQTYAISGPVLGTMPLPYSRRYEGLATGLYAAFEAQDMRLNLAYVRGATERIRLVSTDAYRFAIVSRFAAKEAIRQGEPVQIAIDFGKHTYLSQHVLVFAEPGKEQIGAGMKIGIDYSSPDQCSLIRSLTADMDVDFVEMPAHQLLSALRTKRIDAGVWNHDEIMDKNYQDVSYTFLDLTPPLRDMGTAVMLCKRDDSAMMAIVENNAIQGAVLETQEQVLSGEKVPNY
ncbi:MAG: GntR family transcriptional regulator [Oscillospiraceae bacterium]|nr:GntR family transcriptional regulator [Oscillospiraceae bacterium]